MSSIDKNYKQAEERYAVHGVDISKAIETLKGISLSIHCWQGDDVAGFETAGGELGGGGIQVTGNYPGKARNAGELRADLDALYKMLPGSHRINLHASYGEFNGVKVDRDAVKPEHFKGWIEWAVENKIGIDFNSSFFSHPLADDGFTLSSKDEKTRNFWIDHAKRCREISSEIGKGTGSTCIHNIWIPDGTKDYPVDRMGHRRILMNSLDEILKHEYPASEMKDAVEAKLFGIGSEAYVVGSFDFYLAYAVSRGKIPCIDMGHFHPTELIADKISSALLFSEELLLHVSRPMRWDSDHVVIQNDDLAFLTEELVRSGRLSDIHVGLDFFDASMNRLGAWAIGSRATLQSLLRALIQPYAKLLAYEEEGNNFARMALLEEAKSLPFGDIWDYYCAESGVITNGQLIDTVMEYERNVQSKRS